MDIVFLGYILFQLLLCGHLVFPTVLSLLGKRRNLKSESWEDESLMQPDYAIIVTYYERLDFLSSLVDSVNQLNYENYVVYIVADNFKGEFVDIESDCQKIKLLFPESPLKSNVRSHLFAFNSFIREHDRITIIDGDNLIHPDYLVNLNRAFDRGFIAVQGSRYPKNLDTDYARLDAVGDLYYRYTDRKLLFEAGSSSTLSGSGMAFEKVVYENFIANYTMEGAGFDKVLQYELVKNKYRIAFCGEAIVYDHKTDNSDQLVKQRARWMSTWFRTYKHANVLFFKSIKALDLNGFLFSIVLLRPPLFIIILLAILFTVFNIIYVPFLLLIWMIAGAFFLKTFFNGIKELGATDSMLSSIKRSYRFIFSQFLALLNIRRANKLSVATDHTLKLKEENKIIR